MVLQFLINKFNIIILKLNNIWFRVYSVYLQAGFSLQYSGLDHLPCGLFVHPVLLWLQEFHEVPDHITLGLFNSHL